MNQNEFEDPGIEVWIRLLKKNEMPHEYKEAGKEDTPKNQTPSHHIPEAID